MKNSRCVLVTGGTGTLGTSLVLALAEANYFVVANYWRDEKRALALQQKSGCALQRCDVSDENTLESLFFETTYHSIFHLAGTNSDAVLPRISSQDWGAQLKTNLQSAFLMTRAALRFLPRGGNLVLVSSRVAERGFAGQSAYAASKAAILGLMKTAALEGCPQGIAVNAICPGFAPSALSITLSAEVMALRKAENCLDEADAAQSFAALCLWLLDSGTKVSGQILRPDCRL